MSTEGHPHAASLWACCCPVNLCLKACCCPCLVAGQNHHRIKGSSLVNYKSCNTGCWAWYGLSCFVLGWVQQLLDREDLRKQNNLEGDAATSCLAAFCCGCCELIQTKKELDHMDLFRPDRQHAEQNGYFQQPSMVAVPQGQSQNDYGQQMGNNYPVNEAGYGTGMHGSYMAQETEKINLATALSDVMAVGDEKH